MDYSDQNVHPDFLLELGLMVLKDISGMGKFPDTCYNKSHDTTSNKVRKCGKIAEGLLNAS